MFNEKEQCGRAWHDLNRMSEDVPHRRQIYKFYFVSDALAIEWRYLLVGYNL